MAQVNVDLMIGDWVIDTEFEERPRVDVVECIEPSRVWLRNGKLYTPIEFIKPLELEKIHLVKNGFVANDEEDTDFVYNDGYEIEVMFDEGITEMDIEPVIFLSIEFAEKSLKKEIKCVHELQQAMRIMGIEKEIII